MTSMLYTVLPVGQGTGTLIQVVDDKEVPVASFIIDLGAITKWNFGVAGKVSALTAAARLKDMKEPTLNAVFISHPDDDHINLFSTMLNNFYTPDKKKDRKETLVVERVYYAGPESAYQAKVLFGNPLMQLKSFRPLDQVTNIHKLAGEASNLQTPLLTVAGVDFHVIMANTIARNTTVAISNTRVKLDEDDSYLVNTDSIVLLVTYGTATKRRIVATGDATGMTMAACNERLSGFKWQEPPVLSISLPHHGSKLTTYSVLGVTTKGADTGTVAKKVVKEFVGFLRPESATVSAGEVEGFNHPSPQVIEDFAKYAKDAKEKSPLIYVDPILKPSVANPRVDPTDHFYTAYFEKRTLDISGGMEDDDDPDAAHWPPRDNWYTARTSKAIYNTDYFPMPGSPDSAKTDLPRAFPGEKAEFVPPTTYSPAPTWAQGWEYTISQDGKTVGFDAVYPLNHEDQVPDLIDLAQFPEWQEPLPPVAVVTTLQAARVYRPGRRFARPLP